MQAKFLKNFLGFKRGDFARPPSVSYPLQQRDWDYGRPRPSSQSLVIRSPAMLSTKNVEEPLRIIAQYANSLTVNTFYKFHDRQILENEFPHLFLKMRFDTIRAEPITRFTSSRKALPTRNGVLGRRAWGPTFFTETDLRFHATYCWNIPRDLPAKCQLPEIIPIGTHGRTIHRPAAWATPSSAT